MLGRKRKQVDAAPLAEAILAAFTQAGVSVRPGRAELLITVPGAQRPLPLQLAPMLRDAPPGPSAQLRDFAEGVVRGYIRGMRRRGILIGTHYPLPDDDVAGHALSAAFHEAGLAASFVDPRRIKIQLADGSDAVTDISRYRIAVDGAPAHVVAAHAAEYARRAVHPIAAMADPRDVDLRLRVYAEDVLVERVRGGTVARELAAGLWETVAVDLPDAVMPLPRTGSDSGREAELFRLAITNTLAQVFTSTWMDPFGVRLLHIGGEHPYMAAHAHVLTRYLDGQWFDGAVVAFPLPEVVLVHPIGSTDLLHAVPILQEIADRLVADGHKPISTQMYWWQPSARERAAPGDAVQLGHRPDLRPVRIDRSGSRIEVQCDPGFRALIDRFSAAR
ncbi:hypothetical protein WEH80_23155 [Actinomycetes bacterium KLBMP 9759]